MSSAEYQRLASGPTADDTDGAALAVLAPRLPQARRAINESCARCHGSMAW